MYCYLGPSVLAIRQAFADQTITNHQTAVTAWTARVLSEHPQGERAVALAHLFTTTGAECDSERQLMVGGTAEVDANSFTSFNYVALGHLHCRQAIAGKVAHYSGSPFKYSFSEAEHQKSVNLVEMYADGTCRVEYIPLKPQLDVRCITGVLAEVLAGAAGDPRPNDYLSIRLLDTGALLDPITRLREVYPNVLETPRVGLLTSSELRRVGTDHRTISVEDLFADFYQQITGTELSSSALTAFADVLNNLQHIAQEMEA